MTNFFIDLKLPYSAVVKEQIEIKAVIHNSITSSKVCSCQSQKFVMYSDVAHLIYWLKISKSLQVF